MKRYALIICIVSYLLFFLPALLPGKYLDGSDALKYFYPSRYYLNQQLRSGVFPFWTEKIFLGFPIYADSERAFLSPLNLLSILIFGPFTSYKVLNLVFYLVGSLSFFVFLKRKGVNLLGYTAANFIYYFSFFNLYHLQHFSFTLTMYCFPVAILLVDKFIEEKKLKWITIEAVLFANLIYFGSFQAVFILLFGTFLYLFFNVRISKKIIFSSLTFIVLVVSLSLPLLLPAAQLFVNSDREKNGVSYNEGSYLPVMLVNVVYPYIFGTGSNYRWNQVNQGYLIHETYIYIGIVTLIIALLGFGYVSDIKLRRLFLTYILCFLILGFFAYIPLANNFLPFPFSLFRYWARSFELVVFAASCLAGYFFSSANFDKNFFKDRYFAVIGIFTSVILGISIFNSQTRAVASLFLHGGFKLDLNFVVWVAILALAIFSVKFRFAKYILLALLIFDLYFFGNSIVKDYVRDKNYLFPQTIQKSLQSYKNERVAVNDFFGFWNFGLYFPSWGIYGYSQFVPHNYSNSLKQFGIEDTKQFPPTSTDLLSFLGVSYVSSRNGIAQISTQSLFEPFDGTIDTLDKAEGNLVIKTNSTKAQNLTVKIRNYPGWKIKINDNAVQLADKKSVYLNFNVPKGQNIIEMQFIPTIFYIALLLSFLLVVTYVILYKKLDAVLR